MLERFPHARKPLSPILTSIFTHTAESSRVRSALGADGVIALGGAGRGGAAARASRPRPAPPSGGRASASPSRACPPGAGRGALGQRSARAETRCAGAASGLSRGRAGLRPVREPLPASAGRPCGHAAAAERQCQQQPRLVAAPCRPGWGPAPPLPPRAAPPRRPDATRWRRIAAGRAGPACPERDPPCQAGPTTSGALAIRTAATPPPVRPARRRCAAAARCRAARARRP
jgi:hypothetical protein